MNKLLDGMCILILEDEFLIAMDVEQLCRDEGANEVVIARSLGEVDPQLAIGKFDAAIIDVMLGGASTLDFAGHLRDGNVPFVFASGYADLDMFSSFPGVAVVGKPYSGDVLIGALATAAGRAPASSGV